MLCGVTHIALCISQFLHVVIHFLALGKVHAALPPGAVDEIILIEHLPGRRVHLQDFFWTGTEDAPPWLDPDQLLTLYETRTVHHTATVYLPDKNSDDGQNPQTIPESGTGGYVPGCLSCISPSPTIPEVDQDIGILVGEDPGPRYWLLTVLRGGEDVPSKVELRLARLYRAAFTRQQEKHLGLSQPDIRFRRTLRLKGSDANSSFRPTRGANASIFVREKRGPKLMRPVKITAKRTLPIIDTDDNDVPVLKLQNVDEKTGKRNDINSKRRIDDPVELNRNSQDELFGNRTEHPESFSSTQSSKLRSLDVGRVEVRMQNTSIIEGGATRLIYSVHLGGKPVPAETAAKDMALLSPQEVALELGAPVLIQSEPYLKESRPLALSRKRDAWLLIGATGAGLLLLGIVIAALVFAAKRKRAHSAVSAPPAPSILKKEREYVSATPGFDNTAYTSETEARTDGTSRRPTPGSRSRTPITPGSQDTFNAEEAQDISSDNDENSKKGLSIPWDPRNYSEIARNPRSASRQKARANAPEHRPRSAESMDSLIGRLETSGDPVLENGFEVRAADAEATGSPHSYLSMRSCKQFPNMRGVQPLSRVLEPVVVKHLDLDIDSPEMKIKEYGYSHESDDIFLTRTSSEMKDPGVIGPIVWDLRRKRTLEGTPRADADSSRSTAKPLGRARKRLNELLEDSFSLFGSRDPKSREEQQITNRSPSVARLPDYITVLSETRGKSAHVSPVATPNSELKSRPRTSLPSRDLDEVIPETGKLGPQSRGAWGSRPLSAGPFHRPNLPEVETARVLADSQLPPEDPAGPLIAAIKEELGKFTPK